MPWLPWAPYYLYSTSKDFWLGPLTLEYWNLSIYQAFFANIFESRTLEFLSMWVLFISVHLAFLFTVGPVISISINPVTYRLGTMAAQWIGLKVKNPIASTGDHGDAGHSQIDPFGVVLGVWAAGPIVLMMSVALVYTNVIFYRPLVPVVIPLCLWFAAVLTPRRLTVTTWLLPTSWTFLIIAGLLMWNPTLKGGELIQVAEFINQNSQPGDVVYHATATSYLPFMYYLDEPGYLLDEIQQDGLLQPVLQDAFKIPRTPLESLEYERVWLIWPRDPIMSDRATQRMQDYTRGAQLIAVIHYWQAAPIEIYLMEENS